MDRRTFLQSLAAGAALAGCGNNGSSFNNTGSFTQLGNASLFPGHPDLSDLTSPGELPPTEIPQSERFFGPDEPDLPLAARPVLGQPAPAFLDTFEYVVVVMLENRAFDHFCGYLYPGQTSPSGQPFNGTGGRTFINNVPGPAGGTNVAFSQATTLQTPIIDPAEEFQSLNVALFGEFNPASNSDAKSESDAKSPYNLPDGGAYFPPPMNGFAKSFDWAIRVAKNKNVPNTLENVSTIMQGMTPNLIPVFSQLAQQYTICDNWFCGVPSQTYCNRSMFNAASSSGYVNNSPESKWVFHNTVKTIWDQLAEARVPWKIYYDAGDLVCGTLFINYPRLFHYPSSNFRFMGHFYDDVKAGTLPRYSWVQPRLIVNQNSYHPDAGAAGVKRGEILLNDIYQAIRQSNNPNGSNYLNTLLVVTFDEGGTCYDHVPPPAAVPPGDGHKGELGFDFKRHGQRIPTLLISPWLAPGSVYSQQLDATSFIRTLQAKFGLGTLNDRNASSSSLANVPVLPQPRPRAQLPRLRVRKLSAAENTSNLNDPITGGEGPGLVRMANAIVTGTETADLPAGVNTVGDAVNWMQANLAALQPPGA